MSTATLNGVRVVSVRLVTHWRGVWYADVDLDPDIAATVATQGKATLIVGLPPGPVATLVGTIDPRYTGTFVATVRMRLVGGGGGWDKAVGAKHFNQPLLLDQVVYAETGAEVGEVVVVATPKNLGTDWGRPEGPAAGVFLPDVFWYVDPTTGTTFVQPTRTPVVPDPSLEIMSWDAGGSRAVLACDTVVAPGTPVFDPLRMTVPMVVRDVEQVFDGTSSRATAWCTPTTDTAPTSRLSGVMTGIVKRLAGTDHLKVYRYRVVGPGNLPNTWILQALGRDPLTGQGAPMPDLVPVKLWSGVAGAVAKLSPKLNVLVTFLEGDPSLPVVLGFSVDALPLLLTLDAQTALQLGPTAPLVQIAGGVHPIAFADLVLAELGKIATALGLVGGSYVPPTSPQQIGSAKIQGG